MRNCTICHKDFTNKDFILHLKEEHNLDLNTYLREFHFGKKVGYCLYCGKPLPINFRKANKYCNTTCQLNYRYLNESKEKKEARKKKISEGWSAEAKEKQSKKLSSVMKNRDEDYFREADLKRKATLKEKFGDENYGSFGSGVQKKAMLEKYGVDNIFKLPEYAKNTPEKYEKIRETCREKYGQDWIKRPENVDVNLQKRKETCRRKYGVDHYVQSEEYASRKKDIIKKQRKTKKENGNINSSKEEEDIFNILKDLFGEEDCVSQYSDKRYPFLCDFYIKSLDVFIEYQGYFTHGGAPFVNSVSQKKIIEKWESKAEDSSFYKNAIHNWTIKDVEKRMIAKKNNLHYLEFFYIPTKKELLQKIKEIL